MLRWVAVLSPPLPAVFGVCFMKKIGLSGDATKTPKGKPSTRLKAGSLSHGSKGRDASAIMSLKAGKLGSTSKGRGPDAITKLRAPKSKVGI